MKILLSLIYIIGTFLLLTACKQKSSKLQSGIVSDSVPIKLINVRSAQTESGISATGLVTTDNEAKYSFKISGIIQSILVEEGQFFRKGQLLATLNGTEISAGLDQASINVEKASRDYTRASNLYKDSVYSLEQAQDAKTRLDLAQQARTAIAFNARYSRIYATSDGLVSKKIANVGEVIAAGSAVLSINETKGNGAYILKVGVTDKEWGSTELGQQAKVMLDGFDGDTINASVFRKSQVASSADGSFQIDLRLSLGNLRPAIGMFGKAFISTNHQNTNTLIPYDALIEADGDKAFVFTLTTGGKVKKIPITIDGFNAQAVSVKSGLENTSQVIVSNSAFLNEQSQIKIIK